MENVPLHEQALGTYLWFVLLGLLLGISSVLVARAVFHFMNRFVHALLIWDRLPFFVRRTLNRTRLTIALWARSRQAHKVKLRGYVPLGWFYCWAKAGMIDGYDILKRRRIPPLEDLAKEAGQLRESQQEVIYALEAPGIIGSGVIREE